ncbi:MAG: DUF126 domain-containing protein [Firmicutes bacterium]|jgi:predicted aconitase with swiveling domain|nr:DUF126 domain-containing protein [Bacillota bacterium]
MKIFKGRSISKGIAEGEALVTSQPLSFFGGVDPETGCVVEKDHELFGISITDKILVMPATKGSTASTWALIRLSENKLAPKAIVTTNTDAIIIAGVIIGQIPTVDQISVDPITTFKTGQKLKVNGDKGEVEMILSESNVNPSIK